MAEVQVRRRPGQSTRYGEYSDEDESDEVEEIISGWFEESRPTNHAIFRKARNPDYFSEGHVHWDEGMSLAGNACGDAKDVCWDLQQPRSDMPDPRDDVTVADVEDYYQMWRACFLNRVLDEAKKLAMGPSTGN